MFNMFLGIRPSEQCDAGAIVVLVVRLEFFSAEVRARVLLWELFFALFQDHE